MFRGNHRTFFSSQYSCFRLDDCGNHSQLETCSRKSRAEYQNEIFSFFIIFFSCLCYTSSPILFLREAMFQKKQEKLKKERFTKYSAFPPIILLAGNSSQLFPIHQQSITFVLSCQKIDW